MEGLKRQCSPTLLISKIMIWNLEAETVAQLAAILWLAPWVGYIIGSHSVGHETGISGYFYRILEKLHKSWGTSLFHRQGYIFQMKFMGIFILTVRFNEHDVRRVRGSRRGGGRGPSASRLDPLEQFLCCLHLEYTSQLLSITYTTQNIAPDRFTMESYS